MNHLLIKKPINKTRYDHDRIRLLIFISIIGFLIWTNKAECKTNKVAILTCQQNSKCHSSLSSHPAKSKCTLCHKGSFPNHPQNSKNDFPASNQQCLKCHPQTTDYEYLHAPVAAGDCSACHDPHTNKKNYYIKKNKAKIICYNCHQPIVKKNDTFLHGPVKEGKCELCHTEHGSFYTHLLKDKFSTKYFNDYKKDTYKFCFRCHKIDLLMFPKTSYNTDFRDGKKNLHYLHVNRQSRGIACKFCHNIHASKQPKLMAQQVTFGDWDMPINFKITKNGGTCAPGCHKTESYDRTIKFKR